MFGSNPQFWAYKIASAWELASGLLGGVAVVVKSCLVLLWRRLHFHSCGYNFFVLPSRCVMYSMPLAAVSTHLEP